jgi:hypothetical protein
MRRTHVLSAVAAIGLLAAGGPAHSVARDDLGEHGRGQLAGKLKCVTGVVAVDGTGHVRVDQVRNDRVSDSRRSTDALPATVTAWGLYDAQDAQGSGNGEVLRLDAVTADGAPIRVALDLGKGKVGVESSRFDQSGFAPRLFADGYGFYAYTVSDSGKLQRWALTRFGNDDLRFAEKVNLGSGYADLTSLQSSRSFTHKGVEREYLYATTASGALKQISVPLKKPRKEKARTLKASGYEGVTELSWSTCNGNDEYASLIAISPGTNTATWTTVRSSVSHPRAKLRGPVTGAADWNLSAVY